MDKGNEARTASVSDDADEGPPPEITEGTVVAGRYRVERLLGQGGMGAVYEARNLSVGRAVAIKFLHAVSSDTRVLGRFLREARLAGEIQHRNVVPVLDSGVTDGRAWLVMEYQRGESLRACLSRETPISPERAVALFDPILRALAFVHARGIVHRDVKPDNVFLTLEEGATEPVPRLLDFGIAWQRAPRGTRLTSTGAMIGTPAYMAPEQALGAREVTPSADQYAVGVMLYEALSGALPHEADTTVAMLYLRTSTPPTPLSERRVGLTPAVVDAVMRALSRQPDDRFESVDALREALARAVSTRVSTPSLHPDAFSATVDSGAPPALTPARAERAVPAPSPWYRNRSALALAAAAVMATVLGARHLRANLPARTTQTAPARATAVTTPMALPSVPHVAPATLPPPVAQAPAALSGDASVEAATAPRQTIPRAHHTEHTARGDGHLRMNLFRELSSRPAGSR